MDDLITTKEAASLLGVHVNTLRSQVAAGLVPVAIRTAGGQNRYDRAEILELRARLTPARSA